MTLCAKSGKAYHWFEIMASYDEMALFLCRPVKIVGGYEATFFLGGKDPLQATAGWFTGTPNEIIHSRKTAGITGVGLFYVPSRNFGAVNYAVIVFRSQVAYANAVIRTAKDTVAVLSPK